MKNIITTYILFVIFTSLHSQEINIYQDTKLALMSDSYGNKPFTTDLIFNFKLKKNNYQALISYEYADLQKYYSRVSIGAGIYYNLIKQVEISHDVNIGYIVRDCYNGISFGINNELSIILNKIKINFMLQSTQRTDINEIRFSCFVGIGYCLN